MNKLIFFLIVVLFAYPVWGVQVDNYNRTYLGTGLSSDSEGGRAYAYTSQIEEIQSYNAEGEQQLLTPQVLLKLEKEMLWQRQEDAWSLIVSLFVLVFESVKLLLFMVEMRLILYIIVEAIPNVFIQTRDAIGNWYVLRRDKS